MKLAMISSQGSTLTLIRINLMFLGIVSSQLTFQLFLLIDPCIMLVQGIDIQEVTHAIEPKLRYSLVEVY